MSGQTSSLLWGQTLLTVKRVNESPGIIFGNFSDFGCLGGLVASRVEDAGEFVSKAVKTSEKAAVGGD